MNIKFLPKIQQITMLLIQINAQDEYHAFFDFAGHIDRLDIEIKPSNTDYTTRNYPKILKKGINLKPIALRLTDTHNRQAHRELNDTIKQLNKLLEETQEATA